MVFLVQKDKLLNEYWFFKYQIFYSRYLIEIFSFEDLLIKMDYFRKLVKFRFFGKG